jgi:hypothetical protein
MKTDNTRKAGAFLILLGVGLPIVTWFFFTEPGTRPLPALVFILGEVFYFKYVLGVGAVIVLQGIGLILSSLFRKKD